MVQLMAGWIESCRPARPARTYPAWSAAGAERALERSAACCWWLTLLTFSLNAGWQVRAGGSRCATLHLYWCDLFLCMTLLLWTLALLCDPVPSLHLGPPLPLIALGGLTALAFIGVLPAGHPDVALGMAARLLLLLLFYLYILNHHSPPGFTACALLAALALQALVASGQVLRQSSLGLGALGERQLSLAWGGTAVVDVQGRHWLRAYGLTAHPNVLGGCAAACLLPLAILLPRRLAVPAVFLIAVLLLLTLSRGAFLAVAISIPVFLLGCRRSLRWPRLRPLPVSIVGALAAVLVFGTSFHALIVARFNLLDPLERHSIAERLSTMQTAWHLILRHPLIGVGANNYLAAIGAQSPATQNGQGYVPAVHNAFLMAAAELGTGGALLLMLALLGPAWQLLHTPVPVRTAALAAALAACAVVGFVDFYAWSSPSFRLLWVTLLGLWAASGRSARPTSDVIAG